MRSSSRSPASSDRTADGGDQPDGSSRTLSAAVILSTYNWPHALELALWAYAAQTWRDIRIIVADDGSGPETRAVIGRMRRETGLDIVHVRHEDRGFRKSEILNRAIAAADADYLIFSDGDCIPRRDFVERHIVLAERGRFLVGGAVKLPADVSARITTDEVRNGRATEIGWLLAQGFRRPIRHLLRFPRSLRWAAVLDHLTTTPRRWRGGNSSTWRDYLIEVNGLDMDLAYGGQDTELGHRLDNLGVKPKRIRYRAVAVHLHHTRPWRDPVEKQRIDDQCRRIRRSGECRASRGIAELDPDVPPR